MVAGLGVPIFRVITVVCIKGLSQIKQIWYILCIDAADVNLRYLLINYRKKFK